jgi:hypothetical protein
MIKSIWSVAAGFITVFILSVVTDMILESTDIFPSQVHPKQYMWWMLLIALLYRSAYAVVGGYLTAMFAPKKPMKHVWILASIGFLFATLGLFANLNKPGLWYPVLLVVLTFPSVWLGGKLRLSK